MDAGRYRANIVFNHVCNVIAYTVTLFFTTALITINLNLSVSGHFMGIGSVLLSIGYTFTWIHFVHSYLSCVTACNGFFEPAVIAANSVALVWLGAHIDV